MCCLTLLPTLHPVLNFTTVSRPSTPSTSTSSPSSVAILTPRLLLTTHRLAFPPFPPSLLLFTVTSPPSPYSLFSVAFPSQPVFLLSPSDVHPPSGRLRVVCSRSSSLAETVEAVAQNTAVGMPVSRSQISKPGFSPSSPAGKKVSVDLLLSTSSSVPASPPISVTESTDPAMESPVAIDYPYDAVFAKLHFTISVLPHSFERPSPRPPATPDSVSLTASAPPAISTHSTLLALPMKVAMIYSLISMNMSLILPSILYSSLTSFLNVYSSMEYS